MAPAQVAVQVDRAVSGNTIELADKRRIRLVGILAPSLSQKPWGSAAQDRLQSIIKESNRQFLLELVPVQSAEPKIGERQYGYLWHRQILVNEQLVREGYALAATKYISPQYVAQFVRAQAYARLMAVGIWDRLAPLRSNPGDGKN